jgi:acyl dehydratase
VEYIENRTFDEIRIGDAATLTRTATEQDIVLTGLMSGDVNPAHFDPEYAQGTMFKTVIIHGIWTSALFSTLLGMELPGPGTIYLSQQARFRRPVYVGDTVTATVTVASKDEEKKRVTLECTCENQHGETVTVGTAEVLAPTEKVRRPRAALPDVQIG